MSRGLLVSGVVVTCLLAGGCDQRIKVRSDRAQVAQAGTLQTVERLTCPEREGPLTRTAAAADGSSCTYAGEGAADIQLQLVKLEGRSATEVLEGYETSLAELVPADGPDEFDIDVDADEDGDQAHVRLPGVSIDADGERASVRVGNAISIDADGANEVVRIRSNDETVNVRANGGGRAEITADTGMNGAVRSTYILAAENPGPSGYRLAGYEARGAAGGPMVLAVVKAKQRENRDVFDAMKSLVERNAGS